MKVFKKLGGLVAMVAGPELTTGHRDSWFSLADKFSDLTTNNRSLHQQVSDRTGERDFFIRELLPLADVMIQAKKEILTTLKSRGEINTKELWTLDDEIIRLEMLVTWGRQMLEGQTPLALVQ